MLYLCYSLFIFMIVMYSNAAVCKLLKVDIDRYKYQSLTGLRGLCAVMVIVSHTFWRWGSDSSDYWSLDKFQGQFIKDVAAQMGPLAVSFFFILSGFLFFRFAQKPNKSFFHFFKDRFLRLYPAILMSILLIVVFVWLINKDGFLSRCSLQFLKIFPTPFGPSYDEYICDYKIATLNSGVLWSLVWEIRLYLFIPALFLLLKYIKPMWVNIGIIATILALIVIKVIDHNEASYMLLFACGFISASIEKRVELGAKSFIIGCIMFALMFLTIKEPYYSPWYVVALFFIFYPIMKGFNLGNLFNNDKMQYLGMTSFSLYLNHGLTQFIAKTYFVSYGGIVWQIASALMIGVAAPFLYKYVERKFYK